MIGELTKRPICVSCKMRELTAEEEKGRRCWFCIADSVIKLAQIGNEDLPFPEPAEFGRPDINVEEYEQQKKLAPKMELEDVILNPNEIKKGNSGQKNAQPVWTEKDIEHFRQNFGIDLTATPEQTEIVIHGSDERTFIKFSLPAPIPTNMQDEIKNMLTGVLMQIGAMLTYGRHFKSLLDQIKPGT